MVDVQPRLGPSFITPDDLASQVFRSNAEDVASLPIQWRGVVLLKTAQSFTVADAKAKIASGEWINHTEPHDVYLAFSGKLTA